MAYAAFLLVAVGRVGELVPGLGSLPLAKVAMGIGVTLLIVKWKRLPKLSASTAPFARTALALVAVAVVTAPFSIWPGMSVQFLTLQLPVMAAAVIMCCKISYSWEVLRGIIRVLIVSALALALSAVKGFHGGRASGPVGYDPNDLAYVLVTTLPLALAFALTARTMVRRMINAGVCAVLVIAVLLTSSRGGFFGLVAMLAVLVLTPIRRPRPQHQGGESTRNRIVLPALAVVGVSVLVWPHLPSETRNRLSTVLALGSDYNMDTSDRDSRSAIWERNFAAALRRPVGYGVSAFEMVDIRMGGKFRAAHNSFLQVLVELGFLGLLLLVRMYVLSWRALQKARRSLLAAEPNYERNEVLVFARMLQVALVGNVVAGFFLSMAYSTLLWVLFAVIIACVSLASTTSATPIPAQRSEPPDSDAIAVA
jgi:O-antigen ligase